MIARRALVVSLALLCLAFSPAAARADFGFLPGSLTMGAENSDGTIASQAGSHPYAFSFHFALKTIGGQTEGGPMRTLITDLPPGLVANPQAVPACSRQDFEATICEPSTQIGVLQAILPGVGEATGPLYNLSAPPGVAAQVGFSSLGFTLLGSASVRTEEGYGARVISPNLPLEASSGTVTIWGTPADPSHDPERGESGGLSSDGPLLPFLSLPTSCLVAPELTLRAESKLAPGVFAEETAPMRDGGGNPLALSGCDAVPFAPSVLAVPSSAAAESSAGLDFHLGLPNKGLLNPNEGAVAETQPKTTVVTLPAGIIANPAAANGQGVCSLAEYKAASAVSGPGQGCPDSSKVGTLSASTPLLAEPIEGSVYLATPQKNPFGTLLALYIVASVPARGVLVKQAGKVTLDPATGQLTTTVEGLPPVPYSSFDLNLRQGPRAPLITPQLCGSYSTTALLYPFSAPDSPTMLTAPFTIGTGTGGGACAASEAQLPISPSLSAGTTIPIAGAYSPFVFKLSRRDGEQRFGALETTLPQGLVGKLAGIPYCSEAAIAAAMARSGEGQGAAEVASPSCPAASEVGTVSAGAGAGPAPYYVQGKAYLAGPYKGAPLSMAIITPAIAGPFDVGVVVVRAGLYVNETTSQVTVRSDPLPTIVHGLPLAVRSVAVRVDRSNFILNPTSCEEKEITALLTSTAGAVASLASRFQVGACRGLDFAPKLSLSLKGATKRAGHPALKAVLTQPRGQANIARTSVALPPTVFLDQAHISNPCTRPQFKEGKCPPSSILGRARVFTPLLDKPLEGPVYFRANGGERDLPDVVLDLNGQVHLVVVGFVDAVQIKGTESARIRTTFAKVPDAPVSKFVLVLNSGKKKGLLVNSTNICKAFGPAIVKMRGKNGKSHDSRSHIATSCNE